jgi:NAD(P)H-dependent flavin oxidoreductase YrpB (nitropropane dioxygenase family)
VRRYSITRKRLVWGLLVSPTHVRWSAFPLAAQLRSSKLPTAEASALMAAFGLRYPIFCAGMGTAGTPELAIAVSNGGALGAIGTGSGTARSADVVRQRVSRTKSGTNQPFAVNYLLAFDPLTLPLALDLGAPIIQFAWGIPTAEAVGAIRKAGAKMGIQISSVAGARRAWNAQSAPICTHEFDVPMV